MLQKGDVENVANSIGQKLTDDEIQECLDRYPSEQRDDPTATWNLVMENIVYSVVNNRA